MAMLVFLLGLSFSPVLAQETPVPEQAAQNAPEQGVLNITSTSPAQVYIDHKMVGSTPYKATIDEGTHLVRIVADGFNPFVRRVRVQGGKEQNLKGKLVPGGGTVEFASTTAQASVQIDGGVAKPLPFRLSDLPPGEHSYVITAPKHEAKSDKFVFSQGQNLYLYLSLDSSAGLAEFTTTPAGADVFMENIQAPVGVTPYKTEGIVPDEHTVMFQAKGYARAFRTMDNRSGDKGIIQTKLSRVGAYLRISTNHPKAQVKINGLHVGTGKSIPLGKVEKGIYNVFVSTPDGEETSTRISVPVKGSLHVRAKLQPKGSNKKSQISIVPPLWNQWYFWASIGGTIALTSASSYAIIPANQPIPAPKGDVSVSIP